MRRLTRSHRAIRFIETYCVVPSGPERGRRVKLTPEQRRIVWMVYDPPVYDQPETADRVPVSGPLAAYLALLHTCGPEAKFKAEPPTRLETDIFTLWAATGPDLKAVLKRDGERIVCPELGTKYPVAA